MLPGASFGGHVLRQALQELGAFLEAFDFCLET